MRHSGHILGTVLRAQLLDEKSNALIFVIIYERKNGPISNLSAKISQDYKNKKAIIPCPPGTKWKDVKITLIENEVVRIETPQGKGRFSYHELGMSDGRTRDKRPTILWELLKLFAKNQGVISSKNTNYDPKLTDTAKRLNKKLLEVFKIEERIYTDHYKSQKGYKTKFFFSDQTQIT